MAKPTVRIRSALSLETRRGGRASQRWMELLVSLEGTQSISAAAKAVGLSYKAAWDAIDAMNNLADRPLVERSVGGRGGGGTRLTKRGIELAATYRRVAEEHDRFLERLNASIDEGLDRDLGTIGRLTMMTSARNHFAGKVVRITRGAVNDEIELELSGGERIVSIITRVSAENLGLRIGGDAIALVKASWVIVAVEEGKGLNLSARNRLDGRITKVESGAVNTEVVIELKGGNTVAAIVTNTAAKQLGLKVGNAASAIFKASSVILGVGA
jgi:molybdate transport system regulatory protein